MQIKLPKLSLVLMVGPSGAGKSTFAQKHFDRHEVVSSDHCRGMVCNDENSLEASDDAFALLRYLVGIRLKRGLLTVVDATSVQPFARKQLVALAREHHALCVAIVLNLPVAVCEGRNEMRTDRNFGSRVIRQQAQQLKKSFRGMRREGFHQVYVFDTEQAVASAGPVTRERLYNDRTDVHGPFDIIGDVHGCYAETRELLEKLGYSVLDVEDDGKNYALSVTHPLNRKLIFVGDLVDRGPASPLVLKLVMSMVASGVAYCVPGNHDMKLHKHLRGKQVQLTHGLAETVQQLALESEQFKRDVGEFLYGLISHLVFDDGKLVVAHAGIKEEMIGRGSGVIRAFCLYGETTGEIDEFGLPVRHDWAADYRGAAKVVYGHTPVPEAQWLNRTIDIDTGCVFGGKLTALRYPEDELVSVDARAVYSEPVRPVLSSPVSGENRLSGQHEYDDLLDIEDVSGKRIVQTRLRPNIALQEENSIAALEVMSRWAINPKWLIYLPPTMSPCGTSELADFLEHPQQAMNYYLKRGVRHIICEEKHMGSRAVLVVCRDENAVKRRFGLLTDSIGVCYTRTGRNYFSDHELEKDFLARVQNALTNSGFWETHNTDWVCMDAELMPWSAKAQTLLQEQYASVSAAATNSLAAAQAALQSFVDRGLAGGDELMNKLTHKRDAIDRYTTAYRNYCWPVNDVSDYKLAPFHIMATEGAVHVDKNHQWHMDHIEKLCVADPETFRVTPYKIVDSSDAARKAATDWWLELTGKGGEGMVVKPLEFVATSGKGELLQPAVKCRGSEYLRIIYGAEYDLPEHLAQLKQRGLSRKRSLAIREFALGVEGLERFVGGEPLRRIHESVFGVLALESEAVDPRL